MRGGGVGEGQWRRISFFLGFAMRYWGRNGGPNEYNVTVKGKWWALWVWKMGRHGVGDKKYFFWQKRSPNCDFYGRSTFLSSRNLTSGSGVRGKVGPNWMRKVFNCRSL
jgi:hypothetical protein